MELVDKLLMKINENEMRSISCILNVINYHMKFYLDQFFSDAINVEIRPYKENKNGDTRPTISIVIGYKGNVCSIEDLSGGEEDRVTLCIFLALNELSNSRILFLDESIASLQSSLSCKIIDSLRENVARNKLVVSINHNAEEGLFDKVITV